MVKKNKVRKAPKLIWPCLFGMAALILAAFVTWMLYVSGPRIDGLSRNNAIAFSVIAVIFAALCAWRGLAYRKYQKKLNQ